MIKEIQTSAETKMQRSVEVLRENLAKVRTGRAHTGLLDQVEVEYYGSMVPVSQVANVTLLDARTISVKPYEGNMAAAVEKAIRDSNLGLNPASMGDLIRVPMPMLTEERRKDLRVYPQCAPRCQRPHQKIAERQRSVGRRCPPRRRADPEAHRQIHRRSG